MGEAHTTQITVMPQQITQKSLPHFFKPSLRAVFAQILCEFQKQLSLDTLMIADSALYSAANLALMKNLKWLCRVPLTVAEAKLLVSQLTTEQFVLSGLEGYRIAAHTSNYGGVAQRWLVVESEARKKADLRQLEQRLSNSEKEAHKKLQRLCETKFACESDAITAVEKFAKQLKYHCLTDLLAVEALPDKTKQTFIQAGQSLDISYRIQATLVRDQSVIETETRRAGRFVIATNVIEVSELSLDQMLSEYKAQQAARSRRAEYSVRRTRALNGDLAFSKTPCFSPIVFSSSPQKE
jgi:transposase